MTEASPLTFFVHFLLRLPEFSQNVFEDQLKGAFDPQRTEGALLV